MRRNSITVILIPTGYLGDVCRGTDQIFQRILENTNKIIA